MLRFEAGLLLIVASACLSTRTCNAFAAPSVTARTNTLTTPRNPSTLTTLTFVGLQSSLSMVRPKRKRRRRKDDSSSSGSMESPGTSFIDDDDDDDDDDLPDFVLASGEEDDESERNRKKIASGGVTKAMMGTPKPAGSLKDLISDRSLEANFNFDDMEKPDKPLPEFADLANKKNRGSVRSSPESEAIPSPGSKKGRAMAAGQGDDDLNGILKLLRSIPVIGDPIDEKGNISGTKLLDTGAWIGISTLVLWEVYINSPFFERAGKIIPVVYDILM